MAGARGVRVLRRRATLTTRISSFPSRCRSDGLSVVIAAYGLQGWDAAAQAIKQRYVLYVPLGVLPPPAAPRL